MLSFSVWLVVLSLGTGSASKERHYSRHDAIPLEMRPLTSSRTQLLLDLNNATCPVTQVDKSWFSLKYPTFQSNAFDIRMRQDKKCETACSFPETERRSSLVRQGYEHNWRFDGIPVDLILHSHNIIDVDENPIYSTGLPLGEEKAGVYHHIDFVFYYVEHSRGVYSVAGAGATQSMSSCSGNASVFTYSVVWLQSNMSRHERWTDDMSRKEPPFLHFSNALNGVMLVAILGGLTLFLLWRHVRQDVVSSPPEGNEEARAAELEEKGWKLIPISTFQPPAAPELLAGLLGTGVQLLAVAALILLMLIAGLVSDFDLEPTFVTGIILWAPLGGLNGVATRQFCRTFRADTKWRTAWVWSITLYPALSFGLYASIHGVASLLSPIIYHDVLVSHSILLALSFVTSAVLAYVGAAKEPTVTWFDIPSTPETIMLGMAFSRKRWANTRLSSKICLIVTGLCMITVAIPMVILLSIRLCCETCKRWPCWLRRGWLIFMASVMELGVVSWDLFYLLAASFYDMVYPSFGMLLFVIFVEILVITFVSILFSYHQLTVDDGSFNWWWQMGLHSGLCLLVFLYALLMYAFGQKGTGWFAPISYFGSLVWACITLALAAGLVGVVATLAFLTAVVRVAAKSQVALIDDVDPVDDTSDIELT